MAILLVDNDGKALAALQRRLRDTEEVHIALGGPMGLQRMIAEGPFAVALAEYSMPDMDGIAFLERVKDISPDTVRVLMSRSPVEAHELLRAVNQAKIFHVLPNPCSDTMLASLLGKARRAFDHNTAQSRETSQYLATFTKAAHEIACWVKADARDILGPILPVLRALCSRLGDSKPILTEASLIIAVIVLTGLSANLSRKLIEGREPTREEVEFFSKQLEEGVKLFRHLPHLLEVSGILDCYARLLSAGQISDVDMSTDRINSATILALAMEYRLIRYRTTDLPLVLEELSRSRIAYPARYVRALEEVLLLLNGSEESVSLKNLRPGMIMARPAVGERDGKEVVLVPEGYEISRTTIVFLRQSARHGVVREPFWIRRTVLIRPGDSGTA